MADGDGLKINRIMNGKKLAQDAAAYAESLVCEVQAVTGGYFPNNFILIWTAAYSGEFPLED